MWFSPTVNDCVRSDPNAQLSGQLAGQPAHSGGQYALGHPWPGTCSSAGANGERISVCPQHTSGPNAFGSTAQRPHVRKVPLSSSAVDTQRPPRHARDFAHAGASASHAAPAGASAAYSTQLSRNGSGASELNRRPVARQLGSAKLQLDVPGSHAPPGPQFSQVEHSNVGRDPLQLASTTIATIRNTPSTLSPRMLDVWTTRWTCRSSTRPPPARSSSAVPDGHRSVASRSPASTARPPAPRGNPAARPARSVRTTRATS